MNRRPLRIGGHLIGPGLVRHAHYQEPGPDGRPARASLTLGMGGGTVHVTGDDAEAVRVWMDSVADEFMEETP